MTSGLKKTQEPIRYSWAVTGTEIFAFLNFILAFATLIICLVVSFVFINDTIKNADRMDTVSWYCKCLAINLGVLITFVFSVLLCLGICRKITSFLLSYFVFGVVIDIILLLTLVAGQCVPNINANLKEFVRQVFTDMRAYEPVMYAVIGICVVHILLLSMVYRAWSSIRSRRSEYQKLVDDSIWSTDLSKEVTKKMWLQKQQEIPELSTIKAPKW